MLNRTQFLLCKLAEESAEIAQIALKTQQFGMLEKRNIAGLSNMERIHAELNDLLAIVEMLNDECNFKFTPSFIAIEEKKYKVNRYYNYSIDLKQVEIEIEIEDRFT